MSFCIHRIVCTVCRVFDNSLGGLNTFHLNITDKIDIFGKIEINIFRKFDENEWSNWKRVANRPKIGKKTLGKDLLWKLTFHMFDCYPVVSSQTNLNEWMDAGKWYCYIETKYWCAGHRWWFQRWRWCRIERADCWKHKIEASLSHLEQGKYCLHFSLFFIPYKTICMTKSNEILRFSFIVNSKWAKASGKGN